MHAEIRTEREEVSCARGTCRDALENGRALFQNHSPVRASFLTVAMCRDFLVDSTKKIECFFLQDLISDPSFVPNLEKGVALLEVFTKVIRKCERNSTPPSAVYSTFQAWGFSFLTLVFCPTTRRSSRNTSSFIYGDVHGVAFLLDAHYIGVGKDAATRYTVVDYACKWRGQEAENQVRSFSCNKGNTEFFTQNSRGQRTFAKQ